MKVITVISDLNNSGFINYLKPSCVFHRLNLEILEYEGVFFSNRLKDVALMEYLKNIDDNEIIFFTDASDTYFLAGEEEILEKFHRFESEMVFSAEINCWPDKSVAEFYPKTTVKFKYLNSGGFIGRAGFIKSIYKRFPFFSFVYEAYPWSNQHYWNHIYVNESHAIKIDHDCEIFYNASIYLEDVNDYLHRLQSTGERNKLLKEESSRLKKNIIYDGDRLKSTHSISYPCHMHFPGPINKTLLESFNFFTVKDFFNKN